MASWQAHLVARYSKHFVKRKLKGQREVARIRASMHRPSCALPLNVRARHCELGGVPGEWLQSETANRTLFFIHGGGYILGSAQERRPITTFFAQQGFCVFAPNYRLAPENRFPAAIHDVVEAFCALAAQSTQPLYVAGDSSGAGLALALLVSLRDNRCPMPAAAALFSPWTDLAISGESIVYNQKRCALLNPCDMPYVASLYLGHASATHPLASPLYADLHNLPPLLIHVGADETLLDDSTRLVKRAVDAGVAVEFKIWPVVPHGWQLLHATVPEGRESLQQAADFLRAVPSRNSLSQQAKASAAHVSA